MPEPFSTSVSALMLAVPAAATRPVMPSEFWQPPPVARAFPHGHAVPVPSPKQKADEPFIGPGTRASTTSVPGLPLRHSPRIAEPFAGATSQSKRKVYVVPQRSALACTFCASVSVSHVAKPLATENAHGALDMFVFPGPSPLR